MSKLSPFLSVNDVIVPSRRQASSTVKKIGMACSLCSAPVTNPAYFEKLSFNILHLQLLGHNVNFVDRECIRLDNGFKNW